MARAEQLISLADYERAANDVVPQPAHAYIFGGAGDEITMRDNLAAWQRLAISPRTLVGVGECDTTVRVLGSTRSHPLIVAPMAVQRLAHRDGEIATARAAAATGAVMCVSTLTSIGLAEIARAAPDAARWFPLYVTVDRGASRELIAHAVEQGYEALVVTVDLPIVGVRERELRAPASAPAGAPPTASDLDALIDPDLRWSDIEADLDRSFVTTAPWVAVPR
jgi:4-hydroxymandelate oxidase